jgi:hypothetical protein
MAHFGNGDGAKGSEVPDLKGPALFGCTAYRLEVDISRSPVAELRRLKVSEVSRSFD